MKKIGGMNVAIVCKPAPMPPASSATSQPGAAMRVSNALVPSTNSAPPARSKKSMKAPPTVCVSQNTAYITSRKKGMPKKRFRITLSALAVKCSLNSVWRSTSRQSP